MIKIDKSTCTGCGACANICPRNAIEMIQVDKGFYYPEITEDKCVGCGLCDNVCHADADVSLHDSDDAFLFVNNSIETRKNSSSGGAFSVLANAFIEKGGYVVGAEFGMDFSIQHNIYNDKENVKRFQTSKYVQSNTSDVYKKTYDLLKNGERVLFSGTPCQVSGLITYLSRKNCSTENLLTVDFICHGVGSPAFWKDCLKYYSRNGKKQIVDVNFRGKPRAGKLQNLYIKYANGKRFFAPSTNLEIFYYHFLKNYILRESCYKCKYSALGRVSDITLADCFKFGEDTKHLNDGVGTSFLIMNTTKSMNYIEEFQQAGKIQKITKADYIQPNMQEATPKPSLYEEFWKSYENGFDSALRVSGYSNSKNSLKRKIAAIVYMLRLDSVVKKIKAAK
ncbi:Coenzyme F420 hydrogenase/dehydrogenase, beta subunit C-terminal domain [Pseudobutyrivibrio xylanivorans]|uniref:4Fe-4S dicluster domain-containing protein n=1 Tax=Pseudobutyrivibrio xylanivorans TaxID=185007 RepID=A0A5P6VVT6_PSEXY|nr:Coenzyme F420 hydrogenase/dehydrogenase, beta subunit C-terminal domain [Pseudobutyrivibrio xylanivorans]QFJ56299.1 4Fe-4S dicluster domain-containing protein [Pseudobutyrivibrio xylanivorans]